MIMEDKKTKVEEPVGVLSGSNVQIRVVVDVSPYRCNRSRSLIILS